LKKPIELQGIPLEVDHDLQKLVDFGNLIEINIFKGKSSIADEEEHIRKLLTCRDENLACHKR
jgi:hypothetical protein